jgi:hypothetical protein
MTETKDSSIEQRLAKLKRELYSTRNSTSYKLGNMIVLAIKQPGRNTVLLPYHLCRLFIKALREKAPSAIPAKQSTGPLKTYAPGKPGINSTKNVPKLPHTEVKLEEVALSPHTAMIREKYVECYGINVAKRRFGLYSENAWRRIEYTGSLLPNGESVLDIGVGNVAFMNLLLSLNRFSRVLGIDIKRHFKFPMLFNRYAYQLMQGSVTNLPLKNKCIDVVTCMEVLEHLDKDSFMAALSELRRVSRFRVITVPYDEPEPMPYYHKLRFADKDLLTYFPDAEFILLRRNKLVPWMAIMERP